MSSALIAIYSRDYSSNLLQSKHHLCTHDNRTTLFTPDAARRIHSFRQANATDWRAAKSSLRWSHRSRQIAGKPSSKLQRGWHDYTQVAAEVLARGFILRIDNAGCPRILQEGDRDSIELDWNMDHIKLGQFLIGLGASWTEGALKYTLTRGADNLSPETPLISSLSAPHVGALQNATASGDAVSAEISKGFLSKPSPHPNYIPFRCVPVNVLAKPTSARGGWRLLFNCSWPALSVPRSFWRKTPLASNFCTGFGRTDDWSGSVRRQSHRVSRPSWKPM